MKLDKIRFARLIGYIYSLQPQLHVDVEEIDDLINVDVPQPDVAYPSTHDINCLMALMHGGGKVGSKIEAIKIYRKLTGMPLKESKDQVEKYWPVLSNHFEPDVIPYQFNG